MVSQQSLRFEIQVRRLCIDRGTTHLKHILKMALCLHLNQSLIQKHFLKIILNQSISQMCVLLHNQVASHPVNFMCHESRMSMETMQDLHAFKPECGCIQSSSVPVCVFVCVYAKCQIRCSLPPRLLSSIFHPQHVESFLTLPQMN